MAKLPKVLFFIEGMVPTEAEREAAEEIGTVGFRNVLAMVDAEKPEQCDAVAGATVPVKYQNKPVVKSLAQVVALFRDARKAEKDAANAEVNPQVGNEGARKEGTPAPQAVPAVGWKAN